MPIEEKDGRRTFVPRDAVTLYNTEAGLSKEPPAPAPETPAEKPADPEEA